MGLVSLRRKLAIIPQEPHVFEGSLRSNLDPFGERSDAEVWRALAIAKLDDKVRALPGGLNEPVRGSGDGGGNGGNFRCVTCVHSCVRTFVVCLWLRLLLTIIIYPSS